MKKIIVLLCAVIALASCQQKKYGAFTVSGKVQHAKSQTIILEEIPVGSDAPIAIDSATLKADGSYELRGMGKEESLYRVGFENGPFILVVNDDNNIKLNFNVNNVRAYEVKNSPATESLHSFFEQYSKKDSMLYLAVTEVDSLQQLNTGDSVIAIVRAKREAAGKELSTMVKDFINNSPSPAARIYVTGMSGRLLSQDEVKALVFASADKFKEHSGLAKIKAIFTTQANQKQAPTKTQYFLIGKEAPEISMPDTDGKNISLSSFRGKYVLVDFWASWCGPCRRENPNVVAAYNKFKDKNFTILGVSLDESKEKWLAAIKDDKLGWAQISDLKFWQSSVVPLYNIEGIPFNVLVDPQGKIIANDLRGEDLEKKLAEVLK